MKVLKLIKLLLLENIYTRKIDIKNAKAVFSFTFDDVPISAAVAGAKILENAGATGTYYVALGMEGADKKKSNDRLYLNEAEIKSLHQKGHDIACHTYSHLNIRASNIIDVVSDCNKNTDELMRIVQVSSISHFAYPFGMVSPRGKKELGGKYKTLRTVDEGLNGLKTDLTHLRAINLYSDLFDKEKIKKNINDAVKKGAWLIFYTHDICENHSQWGTTPEDLQWVVDQCIKSQGEILNMNQAYQKLV